MASRQNSASRDGPQEMGQASYSQSEEGKLSSPLKAHTSDGGAAGVPARIGLSMASRVTRALSGLAMALITICCASAYIVFAQMEDGAAEAVLQRQAEHIKTQPADAQALHAPGPLIHSWLVAGPDTSHTLPPALQPLVPGLHRLEADGRVWRVLVESTNQGTWYVRYDATAHADRVRGFGLSLGVLALLCILASGLVARRLGRYVARPITDLTERAATWAPGTAGLAQARGDEVGVLLEVFTRMQNRVEKSIAFEREFVSNLCHEVRTPLAAIRSDSEMALYDPSLSHDLAVRLRRIIASADAASTGLTGASVLTGYELSQPTPMSLRQALEEAWLAFQPKGEQAGLVLCNEIPASARLTLAPYAVLVVMRNLIRNAIEHAAPATLIVSCVAGNSLRFSDDGPGIPADALPLVFERYYSHRLADSGDGEGNAQSSDHNQRGLGLAIAKRVCDLYQWRLSVESVQGKTMTGTIFTLDFD